MTEETDGQMLARLGIDAQKWAEEFYQRFHNRIVDEPTAAEEELKMTGEFLGRDILIGWFANAIEAGRQATDLRVKKLQETLRRTREASNERAYEQAREIDRLTAENDQLRRNAGLEQTAMEAELNLPPEPVPSASTSLDFRRDLAQLLNRYSAENGSNTPDFILADVLAASLNAWNQMTVERDQWYLGRGKFHTPGAGAGHSWKPESDKEEGAAE